MLSGVDLIRAAGLQHERLDRVKPVEAVAPVNSSGASGSSLDGETQNALLRFARFIQGESQPEKPRDKRRLTVSKRKLAAYHAIQNQAEEQQILGQYMDLRY